MWDSPHSHSGRDDKYEAPAIKMNQIGASSLEQVSITTYLSQGIFLNSFICSLLSRGNKKLWAVFQQMFICLNLKAPDKSWNFAKSRRSVLIPTLTCS